MRPAWLLALVLLLTTACESSGAYANRPIPELQSAVLEAHVAGLGEPVAIPLEVLTTPDHASECDASASPWVWLEWARDGDVDIIDVETCSGALDAPWARSVGLKLHQNRSLGDGYSYISLSGDAKETFVGDQVSSFPAIATTGETQITAAFETACRKEYCEYVDVIVVSVTLFMDEV